MCWGVLSSHVKGLQSTTQETPGVLFLLLLVSSGSGWEVQGEGWAQPPSFCPLQPCPLVNLVEGEIRSEERGLGTQVWQI